MGTTFAEILTQYAMQALDDINWTNELSENPAAFLRAKSDTLIMAIPHFSRPPEIQNWLTYTEPSYTDYAYEVTADSTGVTVATGATGYAYYGATLIHPLSSGGNSYTPVSITYDDETGEVVYSGEVVSGDTLDIDLYTDGAFDYDLNTEQKHILGLCVAYQWYSRFANTWLNMQPKIKDKSFDVGSESAQMTANTAKLKETRLALNDALLRYEENVYYRQVMPSSLKLTNPN